MVKRYNIETPKGVTMSGRRKRRLKSAAASQAEAAATSVYEVGYARPPTWTQFKPRQSGNPKGRPKAVSRKKASIARATLEKKLAATNHSGTRKSLRQLAFERIGEKASSGDIKSVNFLLAQENEEQQLAPDQFPVSTETALDIMRAYFHRERANKLRKDEP
jgi:Family of unknown function (DUF5681)